MKRNAAAQQVDIDQWLCDYTACDQEYLLHFCRTGQAGFPQLLGKKRLADQATAVSRPLPR